MQSDDTFFRSSFFILILKFNRYHVVDLLFQRSSFRGDAIVVPLRTRIAAHLRRDQRALTERAAAQAGVPYLVVDCSAPEAVLETRVHARGRAGGDASDADAAVIRMQSETQDPLSPEERTKAIHVDTAQPPDLESLAREIRARWVR